MRRIKTSRAARYTKPTALEPARYERAADIGKAILEWAEVHGRRDLPWQQAITPYKVWVSEVMLQQTQVATVIPFFLRFIKSYPTVSSLAHANEDEVLAHWSGLGFYSRARNLMRGAREVSERHDDQLPSDLQALQSLPGIGRSTAAAILSLGYDRRAPLLDGNVKRVLARVFAVDGWPGRSSVQKQLWAYSEAVTPDHSARAFSQAIMDFGATFCTRSNPPCHRCPLNHHCLAFRLQRVDALPQPRPAQPKPVRSTRVMVVKNNRGQLMLTRNNSRTGVWRGLWVFPHCQSTDDPVRAMKSNYDLDVEPISAAPAFRHTFSHFHLDIHPIVLRIMSEPSPGDAQYIQWCGHPAHLPGGVPAPIHRLFVQFSGTRR